MGTETVITSKVKAVERRPLNLRDWDTATFTAQLYQLHPNQKPHFSITGETRIRGREDMCGCIHDVVCEHWPEIRPFIRLHLADDSGTPMHDVENGKYWAREYFRLTRGVDGTTEAYEPETRSTPERAREILRDHLRLSDAEVDSTLAAADTASRGYGLHPQCWKRFEGDIKVERVIEESIVTLDLRKRWKAEADAFLAFLRS